ncbi:MAG: protein kinase, partial [Planctomycetota bacterium]
MPQDSDSFNEPFKETTDFSKKNRPASEKQPHDDMSTLGPTQHGEHHSEFSSVSEQVGYQPGDPIGPYKLVKRIGEGGMGTVWLAEQEQPVRRRVALKLIKTEHASQEIVARFEAERQALALMEHLNIAKVFDAGTSDSGAPYFVMEFVNGVPLTKYCDSRKLSIRARLQLFIPVCRAVQHAHQKGIIHRDLKPSNVLVTEQDGQPVPKVIDFGLAKADQSLTLTDKSISTEFGRVVGTIQYMSPEQAELDSIDIDTRTDIYSLGVMLYELLTGSTPLDRDTLGDNALLQILQIIREKEPPRPSMRLSSTANTASEVSDRRKIAPSKLQQILKGELDWVVMKALEKDRSRRYATANDLAEDLSGYLSGHAISARPPSTTYRLQKFVTRNKGLVASLAAIAFLLVAGIVGTSLGLLRANQKAIEANEQTKLANGKTRELSDANKLVNAQKEELDREAKNARTAEASATFQLANARWKENRCEDANRLLWSIAPEFRDYFEWRYCRRLFRGSDITLQGGVDAAEFLPAKNRILTCYLGGEYREQNPYTGESETLPSLGGEHFFSVAVLDSSGNMLVGSHDSKVVLRDIQAGKQRILLEETDDDFPAFAFTPDGRIVAVGDTGKILLFDTRTGKRLRTISTIEERDIRDLDFDPAGKTLVSTSQSKRIVQIWNVESGELERELKTPGNTRRIAFHPLGKQFAVADIDDRIHILDLDTGAITKTCVGHTGMIADITFSPSGEKILSASDDTTVRLWNARTGRQETIFRGHRYGVDGVGFCLDGARAFSYNGSCMKFWDTASGSQASTRWGDFIGEQQAVTFSPDGKWIACSHRRSVVKIFDSRSMSEVASFSTGTSHAVECIAFSPNGKYLAAGDQNGNLEFRSTQDWTVQRRFQCEKSVWAIAFSRSGRSFAAGDFGGIVYLWDEGWADSSKSPQLLKGVESDSPVRCLGFDRAGKRLQAGVNTRVIQWNVRTGSQHSSTEQQTLYATSSEADLLILDDYSFGSDGLLVQEVDGSSIKTILDTPSKTIEYISFGQSGTRIAIGYVDGAVDIWDVTRGVELLKLQLGKGLQGLAFNSDATRFAVLSRNRLRIFEAPESGELVRSYGNKSRITFFSQLPEMEEDQGIVGGEDGGIVGGGDPWESLINLNTGVLLPGPVPSFDYGGEGYGYAGEGYSKEEWTEILREYGAEGYSQEELKEILEAYGEESFSDEELQDILRSSGEEVFKSAVDDGVPLPDQGQGSGFDASRAAPSPVPDFVNDMPPLGKWGTAGTDEFINRQFANSPNERAYRQAKGNPEGVAQWHTLQYEESRISERWYAAAFHAAAALLLDPASRSAYDNLIDAHSKLDPAGQELLEQNRMRAFALPRPPIEPMSQTEGRIWYSRILDQLVASPNGVPNAAMMEYLQALVRDFPGKGSYGLLALAQYRAREFDKAIQSAIKLGDPLQEQKIEAPLRLAVIGMAKAEMKGGDQAKGKEYLSRFLDAIQTPTYNSDTKLQTLGAEVTKILSRSIGLQHVRCTAKAPNTGFELPEANATAVAAPPLERAWPAVNQTESESGVSRFHREPVANSERNLPLDNLPAPDSGGVRNQRVLGVVLLWL